jgi:outer membrane protein OmpA-like peptidoglycan-associated protein
MKRLALSLLVALGVCAQARAEDRSELERKVVVQRRRIILDERIYFEHGRARILPVSFPILDLLAEKMQQNPQIEIVQVEGHTDTTGPDEVNDKLSALRARSVRDYLLGRGVKPDRLIAKGFGSAWPVASNLIDAGREKNRRVEFVIIQVLKRQIWRRRPATKDYAVVIRAGQGALERAPEGGTKPLAANHAIYAGDGVETGIDGRAVVRLPGIVLAFVGAESAVRIEALRGDPGGEGRSARLTLVRGSLWMRSFLSVAEKGAQVHIDAGGLRVSFQKAELRLAREGTKTRLEVLSGLVHARAGDTEVAAEPGRAFRIEDGAASAETFPLPPHPQKRAPTRGEVENAQLSWQGTAGAVAYVVEVAKDVDFLDLAARRETAATSVSLDLPAGTYYWQVRARDREGLESASWPIYQFRVK